MTSSTPAAPDEAVGAVLVGADGEPTPTNSGSAPGTVASAEAAAALIEEMRKAPPEPPTEAAPRLPDPTAPPRTDSHPTANLSLRILATIAVFAALYLGKVFFLAVLLALIMKFALARPTRFVARLAHVPMGVASGLTVLLVMASFTAVVWRLSTPALEWVERLPQTVHAIRAKLVPLTQPVNRVAEISKTVEGIANPAPAGEKVVAVSDDPRWLSIVSYEVWSFLVQASIALSLLYFMLATDEVFLRKCVELLPRMADKKVAIETGRAIESEVSAYLFLVTMINLGVGIVLGIVFPLVGLPNPILFAVMAAVLNFVPYIGALVGISVVAAVSLLTFDSLGEAAIPPLAYFLTNFVENMFVTPLVLGKRLTISPVVLFMWLLLWSFLWGIPGSLIAVPLLSIVKIACDHVPKLRSIGVLIGT